MAVTVPVIYSLLQPDKKNIKNYKKTLAFYKMLVYNN